MASDCPRDPNPRSTHDVFDEVNRIKTIYQAKKKSDEQVVCQQALEMLIERNTQCMFNQMDADSISSQSGSVDREEENGLKEKEFSDIRRIKELLQFDPAQVGARQNFLTIQAAEVLDVSTSSPVQKASRR